MLQEATILPSGPTPSAAPSRTFSDTTFLDGLRGLAALYVLIHHASYLLHRGYLLQIQSFGHLTPAPVHPQFHKALVYALWPFRYGNLGVVFFFVLSGLVIHLRYARDLAANPRTAKFGWPKYMWRRFRRIYPPLLFAIAFTAAMDAIGSHLGFPNYRGATPYAWLNGDLGDHHPTTLIGNLCFLATLKVPWFGSDGPLWSLSYEWWFYCLYPLLWLGAKRSLLGITAIVLALFALTFWPSLWPSEPLRLVLGLLPAWWWGAMLAEMYQGRLRIPFIALTPLILLLGCFPLRGLEASARTVITGLAFAGVIAGCFWLQRRGSRLSLLCRLKPLGDFSYTLYIVHMPLLIFMSGWLLHKPGSTMPDSILPMFAGIVIALLFAWAIHFVIEKPFTGARRPLATP